MLPLCTGGGVPAEAFRHEDAVAVHRLLGEQFGDEDAAAEWKARCAKVLYEGAGHASITTFLHACNVMGLPPICCPVLQWPSAHCLCPMPRGMRGLPGVEGHHK